ncbi:MAG: DUF169 domain-containing protein [Proteobacteria bacterium]|nr:DUF169 domain-containing protein [Pseudomonadota bacterium]MBU1450135.1 DUF169 domain-containing protein [Pseudomonadota bacterium]MBU2470113.1 DUF169 domain-containing protein [Pseudomonadota bacterium]MBU2518324.1 DUF169 domain-containing protein [Pseudomonadota bacterium]
MIAPELGQLEPLLEALGLQEPPMALLYSQDPPPEGFHPQAGDLPTKAKEDQGQIDWGSVFGGFSCVMGNIWRARKKRTLAWMSAEHFGCPGGAFYLGFLKPQTEMICAYVSSGIPGAMEGERYVTDPAACRRLFEAMDPLPAPAPYCVFKPLDLLEAGEEPEVVILFARPEVISGLQSLTAFVTNDLHGTTTPWGAGCSHIVTFPRQYAAQGQNKAVIGGWDPSCRKFLKTDELTFAAPWALFQLMLERWQDSFLTTPTWGLVQKKIARSARAWGEEQ